MELLLTFREHAVRPTAETVVQSRDTVNQLILCICNLLKPRIVLSGTSAGRFHHRPKMGKWHMHSQSGLSRSCKRRQNDAGHAAPASLPHRLLPAGVNRRITRGISPQVCARRSRRKIVKCGLSCWDVFAECVNDIKKTSTLHNGPRVPRPWLPDSGMLNIPEPRIIDKGLRLTGGEPKRKPRSPISGNASSIARCPGLDPSVRFPASLLLFSTHRLYIWI